MRAHNGIQGMIRLLVRPYACLVASSVHKPSLWASTERYAAFAKCTLSACRAVRQRVRAGRVVATTNSDVFAHDDVRWSLPLPEHRRTWS